MRYRGGYSTRHLLLYIKLEERVGFEPTDARTSPVFKTGSFNHSDISPSDATCRSYYNTYFLFCQHLFSSFPKKLLIFCLPYIFKPQNPSPLILHRFIPHRKRSHPQLSGAVECFINRHLLQGFTVRCNSDKLVLIPIVYLSIPRKTFSISQSSLGLFFSSHFRLYFPSHFPVSVYRFIS